MISSRRESRSLDNSSTIRIFPWILDARIYNFFENPQPDASNQTTINSLLLLGNTSASYISRTEEDISSLFFCFVDQATPGFELGKKDLQSPALPLGHAAKMIAYEIDENLSLLLGMGGLINFFFYCASILNPVFLNCLYERNPSFLGLDPSLRSFSCMYSIAKHKYRKTFQIEKAHLVF